MGHIPLADNAYLKRRRGKRRSGYRWYVRIGVPADVREVLRKQTIERCLHTSDFKEAQQLRHAVLAEIFESFERARGHRITSADIEHEAQRLLRERLATKLSDDGATLIGTPTGSFMAGAYKISWHATSSDDGHRTEGSLMFKVK
jgi:methionine-rich copper-binding protein CopC